MSYLCKNPVSQIGTEEYSLKSPGKRIAKKKSVNTQPREGV